MKKLILLLFFLILNLSNANAQYCPPPEFCTDGITTCFIEVCTGRVDTLKANVIVAGTYKANIIDPAYGGTGNNSVGASGSMMMSDGTKLVPMSPTFYKPVDTLTTLMTRYAANSAIASMLDEIDTKLYISDTISKWMGLTNAYNKSQSDLRYLQSFTESDPIWHSDSNLFLRKALASSLYYSKTASDARYLQSFTELDPVYKADSNLYIRKTGAAAIYQTKLGFTPYNASNPAGYISSYTETDPIWSGVSSTYRTKTQNDALYKGISYTPSSSEITTALGFTPYNSTNPNGYISSYTETDPIWSGVASTYRTKTQNDLLYQPTGTYLTTEVDPTVPSYSKSLTAFSVIKTSTDALYATAAQGTLASTALQPAGNGSSLTGLTKAQVGLGNVDNTSDATKNSATVTLTNKTIAAGSNTITGINNANLSGSAAISDANISSAATWNAKQNALTAGTDYVTPTGSGAGLTSLNASNITSGTVPTARLGSGTADATKYLAGDQTWKTLPAAGTGTVTSVGISSSDFAISSSPVTTSGTIVANLNTSGVSSGTYDRVTVNTKGIVTAGVNKSVSMQTRSFNTAFQASTTRDSEVKYSVSISCTISLSGGQSGTVSLQTSPDNVTFTEVGRFTNTNTGALTIGLSLTNNNAGQITAFVPAGYYVKLVSTGTGTITYVSGQEMLY